MSNGREVLNQFLLHWWNCRDKPEWFLKDYTNMSRVGLCTNLINFCHEHNLPTAEASDLMEDEWIAESLNRGYPFHDSYNGYLEELSNSTQHLNKRRRGWVEAYLKQQGLI